MRNETAKQNNPQTAKMHADADICTFADLTYIASSKDRFRGISQRPNNGSQITTGLAFSNNCVASERSNSSVNGNISFRSFD
jgi:hypothetical protein